MCVFIGNDEEFVGKFIDFFVDYYEKLELWFIKYKFS